eukprot:CAMPEP_0206061114 /NCGR_PEP_ID=MMETSP1466-20131121/53279_1 /ASSEMBLY_ACC=CAM_ASM_001126 /TAXON_ID=44452 /ORGANISM="Pavlova gyrans, Strain CCMP608" /LENGTH=62 /DNA_ID=CAMNT_0053436457 /DNA_START=64 /DNA_END=247 /DNA_ORIENTATION=+
MANRSGGLCEHVTARRETGEHALLKEVHVSRFEAEIVVGLEEGNGLGMRSARRHHEEGKAHP